MKSGVPLLSAFKHPFSRIALLIGAIVCLFYFFAAFEIFRYGSINKNFGWDYEPKGDQFIVIDVNPHGPAAGKLSDGDRIVEINGDSISYKSTAAAQMMRVKLSRIALESAYTIRIARDSEEKQLELFASASRGYEKIRDAIPFLAISLAFFVNALLIGIYRPDQKLTRLMSIGGFVTALVTIGMSLVQVEIFFQSYERIAFLLTLSVLPLHPFAVGYHFYYRFPQGLPTKRFWSFLQWLFYGWGAIIALNFIFTEAIKLASERTEIDFYLRNEALFSLMAWLDYGFFIAASAAICAVLVRNNRLVKDIDQRRRIKWITYGTVAGLLPIFVYNLFIVFLFVFGYTNLLGSSALYTIATVVLSSPVLVPIAFGYAVIKHRALDVDVVIRRGVQYLFAKNLLQAVLFIPAIGLAYAAVLNRNRTISDFLFDNSIYFYAFLIAALGLRFRGNLSEWIDRRFFREAYDREKILLGLIDKMKGIDSTSEISKLVGDEIDAALHPKTICVFHRSSEDRDLTLSHTSEGNSTEELIAETSSLFSAMNKFERAQPFPFPNIEELPQGERERLERIGVNLIVPMRGTDHRLAGLLLLGEKRSEEPYSPNDCKLLEAVAAQMAIVCENALLKGSIDKERKIKREVLDRLEERSVNLVKECPNCGLCYDSPVQVCSEDGKELTLSLPVERVIDGKYRLERLIGKGGMGAVYKADDLRLGRKIAIKILLAGRFGNPNALRRFEREARASAKLNHRNIIAVYDYGRLDTGGAYLIMEYAKGESLRLKFVKTGKIDPEIAAEWFDQILEGMQTAHAAGVVHRDLKPENILVVEENEKTTIKILDFGLAKIMPIGTSESTSLTAEGTVMGTYGYMPAEQLSGDEVDERADIFSIGVMAVEALTGRRPFAGRSIGEMIRAMLTQSFHLDGSSKGALRLDEALQHCLAREREERFASIAEMRMELIPAIREYVGNELFQTSESQAETVISGTVTEE